MAKQLFGTLHACRETPHVRHREHDGARGDLPDRAETEHGGDPDGGSDRMPEEQQPGQDGLVPQRRTSEDTMTRRGPSRSATTPPTGGNTTMSTIRAAST
jgi:hypothetical protein